MPGFLARNVKLVVGSVNSPEFRTASGFRRVFDSVGSNARLLIASWNADGSLHGGGVSFPGTSHCATMNGTFPTEPAGKVAVWISKLPSTWS